MITIIRRLFSRRLLNHGMTHLKLRGGPPFAKVCPLPIREWAGVRGLWRRRRIPFLFLIALCTFTLILPTASAKEFGVVEDLSVGRNTSTPYGGIGRYQNLLKYSEDFT